VIWNARRTFLTREFRENRGETQENQQESILWRCSSARAEVGLAQKGPEEIQREHAGEDREAIGDIA